MKRILILPMVLLSSGLFGKLKTTPEEMIQRISAHLLIRDMEGLAIEADLAYHIYPNDPKVLSTLVKAYAESRQLVRAMEVYKRRLQLQPLDLKHDFSMVESLAWGGLMSNSLLSDYSQVLSLIGSFYAQDARSTRAISESLKSRNAKVRAMAVRMCTAYRDQELIEGVQALFLSEKNFFVRLELIQAAGQLGIKALRPHLEALILDHRTSDELKAAALQAITVMEDDVSHEKIRLLIKSPKAGFRQLAASLIGSYELHRELPELFYLLDDANLDVRLQALCSLTLLDLKEGEEKVIRSKLTKLAADEHPYLSMTAAILVARYDLPIALETFSKWLRVAQPRVRRFAAAAVSMCGEAISKEAYGFFEEANDVFVKANLAMGLLKQRVEVEKCSSLLHEFLKRERGLIMFEVGVHPFVATLVPSRASHLMMPQYPEIVDEHSRLHMINLLAIVEYPEASELIKDFLSKKLWGINATASMLLLEEGDSDALDLVKSYLDDPDENLSMQAALALANFGKEVDVAAHLIGLYPKMEWEKKVQIIEALGKIGNRESIPFLIERLADPFQMNQVAAASSMIQCLYH